jgi:hypothetical protein
MDLLPDKEQSGGVPAGDNPQPEHPIEPNVPGTTPLSSLSRNFTVISNPDPQHAAEHYRMPLWLERLLLFIRVAFAVWVGLFLLGFPWWDAGRAWSENAFLLSHPALRAFLALDFVRGIVSGVGLVDIWIGIWWAVHYKEVHLH